jgi:hypothetical protein
MQLGSEAYKRGARDEIVPRLFLGDVRSCRDEKSLKEASITHVLSISHELRPVREKLFNVSISTLVTRLYQFRIQSTFSFKADFQKSLST